MAHIHINTQMIRIRLKMRSGRKISDYFPAKLKSIISMNLDVTSYVYDFEKAMENYSFKYGHKYRNNSFKHGTNIEISIKYLHM